MINVKNMRIFLAALRSRKYKQYRGSLYGPDNKACALGVAGRELLNGSLNNYIHRHQIRETLGLSYDVVEQIILWNDWRGMKFYQIARHLEKMFKKELSSDRKGKKVCN